MATYYHDITQMSLGGLRGQQRSIHDLLIQEDVLAPGAEKLYGMRDHADWRAQSDEIEAELDRRGETYAKVPW